MPCPQADTLMNLESATFFYVVQFNHFYSSNLETKNKTKTKTNKQTKKPTPNLGKNGASLSLNTIG